MKNALAKLHKAAMTYVTWGWPILLIVGALDAWQVEQTALWHRLLDNAGFAYMLCAVAALATFVIDKSRHERAMARLFGVREGDERERTVTGDAARTTLLLSLALQIVLLLLSLTTVKLVWNAAAPKGTPHGLLAVGFQFSSSDQLSAFKLASSAAATATGEPGRVIVNGYVLPPATFPVLLALILLQIASFKAFSRRRYEGMDA